MRVNRKFIAFFVIVMLMLAFSALFNFRQEAQITQSVEQDKDELPTVVSDGARTARQQVNGKFFSAYGSTKLTDLVNRGNGEITVEIGPGMTMLSTNAPPFDRNAFLRDIGCDADAIVIGEPQNRDSQITESGDFIFTDYEFKVDQILKNNINNPIVSNTSIIVTRTGGKVAYRGRVIRAIDKNYGPFKLNGTYLLYLKFLPESASYIAFSNGSFYLKNDGLVQLGGHNKIVIDSDNSGQFINLALSALMPCAGSANSFRLQ